jgi:hypothetical protein
VEVVDDGAAQVTEDEPEYGLKHSLGGLRHEARLGWSEFSVKQSRRKLFIAEGAEGSRGTQRKAETAMGTKENTHQF